MDGLKNYTVMVAEIVIKNSTTQPDGSLVGTSKTCGNTFVQVIKHTTDKTLEGSSMRQTKGIIVHAYNSIRQMLAPNAVMIIGETIYSNLEVSEIVGNKTKVQIVGYA
jgi:hypothetical protein